MFRRKFCEYSLFTKLFIVLLCLLLASILRGQVANWRLNLKFGDIPWGSDIHNHSDLTEIWRLSNGGIVYTRKNGSFDLFKSVRPGEVYYIFKDSKFAAAAIRSTGSLEREMCNRYGFSFTELFDSFTRSTSFGVWPRRKWRFLTVTAEYLSGSAHPNRGAYFYHHKYGKKVQFLEEFLF